MSEHDYLVAKASRRYKEAWGTRLDPTARDRLYLAQDRKGRRRADMAGSVATGEVVGGVAGAAPGTALAARRLADPKYDRALGEAQRRVFRASVPTQRRANKVRARLGRPQKVFMPSKTAIRYGVGALSTAAVGGGLVGSSVGGGIGQRKSLNRSIRRGDVKIVRNGRKATSVGWLGPKYSR